MFLCKCVRNKTGFGMTEDINPESPESSIEPDEPIDAHFEPASDGPGAKPAGNGPGWLGAGVMSLMAAGIGGAIGIGAHMLMPSGLGDPGAEAAALNARIDTLEQAGPDERAALKSAIDTLAKRIDTLPAGSAPVDLSGVEARLRALESVEPGESVAPEELARALTALTDRIEAVEDRPVPVDSSARIAALETEIARLRADIAERGAPDAALASILANVRSGETDARAEAASAQSLAEAALALSSIEAASRQGRSFEADYRALRTALPKVDAVRALGPLSATGAPTLGDLKEDFTAAAEAARKTVSAESGGQWGWVNKFFGGAVTVRKADGTDDDPFGLISRAGEALEEGDLAAAVAYTDRLDGTPGTAMSAWTEAAKRRISLETSLEAVRLALADGGAVTP